MEPRSRHSRRPANETRASGYSASAVLVRAARLLSGGNGRVGKMDSGPPRRHACVLASHSASRGAHQVIGRLKYPFTSLWRRVGCHLAPAITALILGAFAI